MSAIFNTRYLSLTLLACASVMGLSIFGLISPAYATCNPCITFDNTQYPNNKYFVDHGMFITVRFDSPQASPLTVTVQSKEGLDATSSIAILTPAPVFTSSDGGYTFTLPTSYVYLTTGNSDPNKPSIQYLDNNTVIVVTVNGVSAYTGIQSTEYTGPDFITTAGLQPDLTVNPYTSGICSGSDNNHDGICTSEIAADGSGLSITYNGATYRYYCSAGTSPPATYVGLGTSSNPDPICPTDSTGKDIFLEVDWFVGHQPSKSAIDKLVATYANKGVRLHVQLDDAIPYHSDSIQPPSNGNAGNTDFDNLKKKYFGTSAERTCSSTTCSSIVNYILTAKRLVFHYAIFAHGQPGGYSGTSEDPGNDIMISLSGFSGGIGTSDQQTGTLMHELGHNLGLLHGGGDSNNCKPNYPSVMSYTFQMPTYTGSSWIPQYSNGAENGLYEISLSEPAGLWPPSPAPFVTFWYTGSGFLRYTLPSTGGPVNWNGNAVSTDTGLSIDVDNLNISGCTSAPYTTLVDYNDWYYAEYDMWNPNWTTSSMQDGAP